MKTKLLLVVTVLFAANISVAQGKKPVTKPPAIKPPTNLNKLPMPKLKSFFGNMEAGDVDLKVAVSLIDKTVIVKDEKGTDYTIDRFTLSWKTTDYFEDPDTGEKKSHVNNITKEIFGNTITQTLQETLIEELKKTDSLLFEKIYVKAKNGNTYLAPSMKFTIR